MPATAANEPGSGASYLAPVVSLTSRRGVKAAEPADLPVDQADAEIQQQARRYWEPLFKAAGIDMGSPESVAVIQLVTRQLERLVTGLNVIREGNESLAPNPDAGVDFTSAVELTGVLRDLAHAAQAVQDERG